MVAARQRDEIPDTLILVEHPNVITLGRGTHRENVLAPGDIPIFEIERGGDVTYHGPGQLVGYPIMAIEDVLAYVRALEASIVAALARLGVDAHARPQDGPDYTGVWVAERKIASIGVHVQRQVSTHGFAVNLTNDLEPFRWVVACGLPDVRMTSLQLELAGAAPRERPHTAEDFRVLMIDAFCETFGRRATPVGAEQLHRAAGLAPVEAVL
jgi:lipoyl(octanoyl) transferase